MDPQPPKGNGWGGRGHGNQTGVNLLKIRKHKALPTEFLSVGEMGGLKSTKDAEVPPEGN